MAHRQEEPSKDVKAMEGTFSLSIAKSDFKFNAAHFMVFGDGTRERLHGHNYQVSVDLSGSVGEEGYVVDFSVVKKAVRGLCKEWDEVTLLPGLSPHVQSELSQQVPGVALPPSLLVLASDGSAFLFPEADVRVLPIASVSVEHLARLLSEKLISTLGMDMLSEHKVCHIAVGVQETPGQKAVYSVKIPLSPARPDKVQVPGGGSAADCKLTPTPREAIEMEDKEAIKPGP